MKTKIINLYGGPGSGKSTIAAGLYFELKCLGYSCEIASEYAKDKIWEENIYALRDQPYIFGNQMHRIWRLNNKVEYIICDSPVILTLAYSHEPIRENKVFTEYVISQYNKYYNKDYFIKRNNYESGYDQLGREQSEEQAIMKDIEIKDILDKNNIDYITISESDSKKIVKKILDNLNICKI